MTGVGTAWTVERISGSPAALHTIAIGPSPVRLLRWCSPVSAAVVLGRGEPDIHIDRNRAAAQGLEVVRRTSGGGAVLVAPGSQVWADLVIGRDDPLWDSDVGRAAWWVGDAWVRALRSLGVAGLDVHHSGFVRRPWSDRICFAGLGAGEVTKAGRKVVGIAARRTKAGALFQCGLLLVWEPALLIEVLRLDTDGTADESGGGFPSGASDREARARLVLESVAPAAVGLHELTPDRPTPVAEVQRALLLALRQ